MEDSHVTVEFIRNKLREIEDKMFVRVVFAVESGSRAWGFPSRDSDYDVRFVYHYKTYKDYVRMAPRGDVIQWMRDDKLVDLHGWDIVKTLRLAAKSNPNLIEWLTTPIVYVTEGEDFRFKLLQIMKRSFNPTALIYHYRNIAKGVYMTNERTLKSYGYKLRPLLACQWMKERDYAELPPITLYRLVTQTKLDGLLTGEILRWIDIKSKKIEQTEADFPILDKFIERQLEETTRWGEEAPTRNVPPNELDDLLWSTLNL